MSDLTHLHILRVLASGYEPMSARDVSTHVGVSRATAYRALEELGEEGWLIVEGSPRRYAPSLRLAQLGIGALRHNPVRELLLPHAIELARLTRRVCGLAFYERGEVVYTDAIEIYAERTFPVVMCDRSPATTKAAGKILLAHQPAEEIESVLAAGIPKLTRHTKTDPDELRAELEQIRAQRWAHANREAQDDSVGIAVAVFNANGEAVAALGVNLLLPVEAQNQRDLVRIAQSLAVRASIELGYRPRKPMGLA